MLKTLVICSVLLLSTSCIGGGLMLDPANGTPIGVEVKIEDCLSADNVVGKLVGGIYWLGPKLQAYFGCPPVLPLPDVGVVPTL